MAISRIAQEEQVMDIESKQVNSEYSSEGEYSDSVEEQLLQSTKKAQNLKKNMMFVGVLSLIGVLVGMFYCFQGFEYGANGVALRIYDNTTSLIGYNVNRMSDFQARQQLREMFGELDRFHLYDQDYSYQTNTIRRIQNTGVPSYEFTQWKGKLKSICYECSKYPYSNQTPDWIIQEIEKLVELNVTPFEYELWWSLLKEICAETADYPMSAQTPDWALSTLMVLVRSGITHYRFRTIMWQVKFDYQLYTWRDQEPSAIINTVIANRYR